MSVHYGSDEQPRYTALRRRVDDYYAALLPPLAALRSRVLAAIARPGGAKDAEDDDEAFRYLGVTRQVIDDAVELFLAQMAGQDRTRDGFSAVPAGPAQGDGIIQEQDRLAFVTGLSRGADLLDRDPTLSGARQSPAVRKMLDDAFERLSEKGQLRLESVKDDIHAILTSAQNAGLNPIETARQLSRQFDQYQGWEFQRLARTEAAFASERGVREQMQGLGVEKVEWLISAGACPICEDLAAGGPYAIDDEESLPPAHPNCLCSCAPVEGDSGGDGYAT